MNSDYARSKVVFHTTKPKHEFNDKYKSYDKRKTRYDEKFNLNKDNVNKNLNK